MSYWSSFPSDLLGEAKLSVGLDAIQFMFDWNYNASSDCGNNPVDISHFQVGSTDCRKLTVTRTAQNYPSHQAAAAAFSREIHSGRFPDLLGALQTAHPQSYSNPSGVAQDLKHWGSPKMAAYYLSIATAAAGPPPTLKAPQALRGWSDLQRSVNRHMPAALRASQHARNAARRELRRAGKVRL